MESRRFPRPGLLEEGGGAGRPPGPEGGPGFLAGAAFPVVRGPAPAPKSTGMSGGGAGILELEGGGGPLARTPR